MKKLIRNVSLAAALALGAAAIGGTPLAPSTPKAEAASYTSCYKAMDGRTWCWRYACTYFERVALGCYDGWVPTTTLYRV